jgi:hypothetical protein
MAFWLPCGTGDTNPKIVARCHRPLFLNRANSLRKRRLSIWYLAQGEIAADDLDWPLPKISAAGMLASPLSERKEETPMALYELRTYTLQVGKMTEAVKLRPRFLAQGF